MTKTYLAVPKDEARKHIEAQIAKGREMLRTKIHSRAEFKKLEDAYDRWTDYNIQLCRELFTEDSIANEVHWHKAQLLEDRTLKEDLKHFQARIRDQLNKLLSINERIAIMSVGQQSIAVDAALKTKKEKGVKELIKSNRHWIFEGIGTQTVKWIGSGLAAMLAILIGRYIWTKQPANTSQPPPSHSPTAAQIAVNTPVPNLSPNATTQASPGPSAGKTLFDANQIVSSVDPALWPQLIGTWQQKRWNQKTGQFDPTPFKVQFYSEGGLLKCELLFPPNPNFPKSICTKLIVDGSRITFSFGGSDYTGTMDLKRHFMDGKIISYGDNEYRGDWALTR